MGFSRGYADTLYILEGYRHRDLTPSQRLATAVALHLESNLFPPVPAAPGLVQALVRAVKAAAKGKGNHPVRLPNGVRREASALIEDFRLGPVVDAWVEHRSLERR